MKVRQEPIEEARAVIRALMDEGLSLEDIAFLHGWDSAEGLRRLMAEDPDD